MFYGPIHSAEESPTVLHQAVKVHFLEEVTLSLTEVICVKPEQRQIINTVIFHAYPKESTNIERTAFQGVSSDALWEEL